MVLWHDVRQTLRLLIKTPGFTTVAILMLALGTGANAALFSVVDGVLLRSPYGRIDEIAQVATMEPNGRASVAVPRDAFARLAAQSNIIAAAATYSPSSPVATGIDVPRRVQVECVPASMIDVLGASPLMGRWFTADEDRPGGASVTVVSFRFWQNDLRADPNVLGRTITVDGDAVAIIGVMRRGFNGVLALVNRHMWVPAGQTTAVRTRFGCRAPSDRVNAFVRLQPGLSAADATRRLDGVPASNASGAGASRLVLLSMSDQLLGDLRGPFAALVIAVLAVLLIACANVANLSLQRLLERRRELAIRTALGATRGQLVRQTLAEHMVLAVAGSAVGVLLAFLTLDALVAVLPRTIPHLDEVRLNGRVLGASIGVALLCATAVGLIPAMRASAGAMRAGLAGRDRGSMRGAHALRRVFVVAQVALGVALLVGALLMIQTFLTLRPSSPGFDARGKTIALARLPAGLGSEERRVFFEEVARELERLPGVRAVAGTTYVPMSRAVDAYEIEVAGAKGRVFTGAISPNYLDLMRIPVRRGRPLAPADGPGAPGVAVVNEAFVRRWLAGREPLGEIVQLEKDSGTGPLQIVGVIGDMRSWGGDTLARPEIYVPFGQALFGSPYFVIDAEPRARVELPVAMRRIVSRLRPDQLVDIIDRLDSMLGAEIARPRFGAWLFGLLAALAVSLSALGLTATLAWTVAEARHEIGLRMALGARPHQVGWQVIKQTLTLSVSGITVGLALAALSTQLLEGWLYGVKPLDPMTFVAGGVAVVCLSLAAAFVPARRAIRVDPLIALKTD